MPTSDLDMPLLPSAEQISRREFATVRRGYDPQQVRTYLTSIATQVGTLERELSQLRLEAGSAAARSGEGVDPDQTPDHAPPIEDPYDALSTRFASLRAKENFSGVVPVTPKRSLPQCYPQSTRLIYKS